jgi:hypothetical protein
LFIKIVKKNKTGIKENFYSSLFGLLTPAYFDIKLSVSINCMEQCPYAIVMQAEQQFFRVCCEEASGI